MVTTDWEKGYVVGHKDALVRILATLGDAYQDVHVDVETKPVPKPETKPVRKPEKK